MIRGGGMLQRQFFVKFSWFEFVSHEATTKWPQNSMTLGVHCSCKLSSLPHRNKPISASCAPALQHAFYAYAPRGSSPLHVSATCLLECADLKDVAFDYLWDILLLHPTVIFVFRKGLQRGTIWIDFRQIIVTMQFFTSRWGIECKVYDVIDQTQETVFHPGLSSHYPG